MASVRTFTLGVVGGASGVGKTTLLEEVSWLSRINTGDLFKKCMSIGSRDDIRASDWSRHEGQVADDISTFVRSHIGLSSGVVIDTHFAAKLNGGKYRIGLDRKLIFEIALAALSAAASKNIILKLKLVHIDSNPHDLLKRRRVDNSRRRELVPSDCVRALTRNRECAGQYLFEFARARNSGAQPSGSVLDSVRIRNDDLITSKEIIRQTFLGAQNERIFVD